MPRVAGIDWATDPKKRALVVLEVSENFDTCRVTNIADRVEDSAARDACTNREHAVVAIDTPFGWPSSFADFVAGWRPSAGAPAPPSTDEFRFRLTDRLVRDEVPKDPLSVSADRIAMGARAWTALVAQHALGPRIDTSGAMSAEPPTLIEVYPGASARALGGPSKAKRSEAETSYKGNGAVRRRLVERVGALFSVDLGPHLDEIVSEGEDSDETDAFLAAVTGAIYLADCNGSSLAAAGWRVRRPGLPKEAEAAAREGWIFYPVRR